MPDFLTLLFAGLTLGAVIGLSIAVYATALAQAERDLVNPDLTLDGDVL